MSNDPQRTVEDGSATAPGAAQRLDAAAVAADLLRLADKIENEHMPAQFCACCSTDAIYLRDLAARYVRPGDSTEASQTPDASAKTGGGA